MSIASIASIKQLVDAEIASGIPANRIVIGGFSQGCAVALEYSCIAEGMFLLDDLREKKRTSSSYSFFLFSLELGGHGLFEHLFLLAEIQELEKVNALTLIKSRSKITFLEKKIYF